MKKEGGYVEIDEYLQSSGKRPICTICEVFNVKKCKGSQRRRKSAYGNSSCMAPSVTFYIRASRELPISSAGIR
jgi:hypothetical protein